MVPTSVSGAKVGRTTQSSSCGVFMESVPGDKSNRRHKTLNSRTRKHTRRSRRIMVRQGDTESFTRMIEPLFTAHGMEYLRTTTASRKTSNTTTLTSLFTSRPKLDQPTLHDAKMKITLWFMSILLTGALSLSIKRQNNVPSCEDGDTSDVNDFFTGSESQVLFCNA